MTSPRWEPDLWNAEGVRQINNCYNYATNRRFDPGEKRRFPGAAEPGRSSGVTAGVHVGADALSRDEFEHDGTKIVIFAPAFDLRCEGLKAACLADGLKESQGDPADTPPPPPRCDDGCWLVAYYRKPAKMVGETGTYWENSDYHFVRQDADGNWSHKSGDAPASRGEWDPAKNDFAGPDVTNPRTARMRPEYEFCGYLCVCDDARVAMAEPPPTGRGIRGATVTVGDMSSLARRLTVVAEGTDFAALLEEWTLIAGGVWRAGFPKKPSGRLRYRLDVGDPGDFTEFTLLVCDRVLTAWDGRARHLSDPKGRVAGQLDEWFAREPWEARPVKGPFPPESRPRRRR